MQGDKQKTPLIRKDKRRHKKGIFENNRRAENNGRFASGLAQTPVPLGVFKLVFLSVLSVRRALVLRGAPAPRTCIKTSARPDPKLDFSALKRR